MFVAPSPKKVTATVPSLRYCDANPAPRAIGMPPPTIALAPSMPRFMSTMCIEPPRPLQYPVVLPYSSANIGRNSAPFAIACPWPRCVDVIWSASVSAEQHAGGDRLLADVQVQEPGHVPGLDELARPLLEASDAHHAAVQVEDQLTRRGRDLVEGFRGCGHLGSPGSVECACTYRTDTIVTRTSK